MTTEAPPAHTAGTSSCPRCGAPVARNQDWCLECGVAARTRIAATPNWRGPVALVVALVLAAGVAIAIAFATLTDDDTSTPTTSTAAPAATAPATTTAP